MSVAKVREAVTQGTTPTFTFTAPEGLDMTQAVNVYVTFEDLFTKSGDDIEVTEHTVAVFLTQEETMQFEKNKVRVQINWTYHEGEKTYRAASTKMRVNVDENLLKEVVD